MRGRQLASLVGFWIAFVLPGCHEDRPAQGNAVGAETAWLDDVHDWLDVDIASTYPDCRRSFDADVGAPPTDRLKPLERLVGTLCDRADRWQGDEQKALASGDSALYYRSITEERAVSAAYRAVEDFLATYRPGIGPRTLPRLARPSGESRIEPTFTRVARKLTGTSVVVRCWSKSDWPRLVERLHLTDADTFDLVGYANEEAGRIELSPTVCGPLADFVYRAGDPSELDVADAAETLTHEATHVGPTPLEEEDVVECYALQHMRRTAVRLGATRTLAARLSRRYWQLVYPTLPAKYRSAECRENGNLDLHLPNAPWD